MYELIVCETNKNGAYTLEYPFEDADSLLEGMTTIGYIFLKDHLRKKDGVRMTFEIVNGEEEVKDVVPGGADTAGE